MKYCLLAALLSVRLFAGIADSDSGIFGPKYTEILAETESWKANQSNLVTLIDYGKSLEGRTLRLVIVMKSMNIKNRPTFLMSGSTHGDEYLGIEDKLPIELLKRVGSSENIRQFLDSGGAFVFVPILNPDGYDHRRRGNAKGIDLNRDWDVAPAGFKGFTQPETQQLSQKLEALTQAPYHFRYQVTVDYHCCIGAILYPWSYTATQIPQIDLDEHVKLANIAKSNLDIDHGTSASILGYSPMGTTKDYYYAKYHSLTFTYEGRYKEEANLLDKHLNWWEEMVGSLSSRSQPPLFSFISNYIPFLTGLAE